MNLWQEFVRDFPITARIPVFKYWAFGQYARGYEETIVRDWGRK